MDYETAVRSACESVWVRPERPSDNFVSSMADLAGAALIRRREGLDDDDIVYWYIGEAGEDAEREGYHRLSLEYETYIAVAQRSIVAAIALADAYDGHRN